MAKAGYGGLYGGRLAQLLGLEPQRIIALSMDFPVDGMVTVTAQLLVKTEELEALLPEPEGGDYGRVRPRPTPPNPDERPSVETSTA